MKNITPDYKRIYTDILNYKFPEKTVKCEKILNKNKLNTLDVLKLNELIFGSSNTKNFVFNQKHKSYKNEDIIEILNYQQIHKISNMQLATHFKLSRNTITRWKKK